MVSSKQFQWWKLPVMVLVTALLLLGCAGMLQEQLIFFPESLDEEEDLSWTGAKEVFVDTEDGARIHGLLYEADEPRGVVLYFHGNAGSVASWADVARQLHRHGVDVFLIDYRTYGKSSGEMSEEGLYLDGEATYDYLVERGYSPHQIIVHGRSLGSAVATHVASDVPVGAVVLETPFTDLPSLARDLYLVPLPGWFFQYELDNLDRSQQVDAPTWVVHGTDDEVVPLDHGREVYARLGSPWKMTIIDGGRHNNLMSFGEYRRELAEFYDEILGETDEESSDYR